MHPCRSRRLRRASCVALGALAPALAAAQLKWIDRPDEREDTGIYSRTHQKQVDALALGGVIGLALAEGTETRLGRTAWQAMDAAVLTAATTETMKHVFGRPRPSQNLDPTVWFAGSRNRSFPSGEVAMVSALATPFILNYRQDHPAVWALAAVPLYMGRARMASHGHWLTDVLAGAAVGAGYGWYATQRETPLVLAATGHTVFIGLRYRF